MSQAQQLNSLLNGEFPTTIHLQLKYVHAQKDILQKAKLLKEVQENSNSQDKSDCQVS